MLYNIYTLNYNNYYNRRLLKENSLSDYLANRTYKSIMGANFNSADGVRTTITNIPNNYGEFNYCIVCDTNNNIVSRWFIIDSPQIKEKQQSIMILKRDTLVDFLEELYTHPIYLEKGFVSDDSPLSVIKEPITVNQIKKGETFIDDILNTNEGWVAIYSKTFHTNFSEVRIPTSPSSDTSNLSAISSYTSLAEDDLREILTSNFVRVLSNSSIGFNIGYYYNSLQTMRVTCNLKDDGTVDNKNSINYVSYNKCLYKASNTYTFPKDSYLNGEVKTICQTYYSTIINNDGYDSLVTELNGNTNYDSESMLRLLAYNDRKISIDSTTYILHIQQANSYRYSRLVKYNELSVETREKLDNFDGRFTRDERYHIGLDGDCIEYVISLEPTQENNDLYTTMPSQQIKVEGEPYYCYLIPWGKYESNYINPGEPGHPEHRHTYNRYYYSRLWLSKFIETSSSNIIDVQLLPYFPLRGNINNVNGKYYIKPKENDINTGYVTIGNDTYAERQFHIWILNTNKFEFTDETTKLTSEENRKITSNTKLYRLVSPNYQSKFDFNLAMNNNSCDGFNIKCTYKPYQPMIYVQPFFTDLYGTNYTDDRGLICTGDFSLSQLQDEWQNYQINNKMYDKTFSRDIQNMQFTQHQELVQGIVTAGVNTISSTAMGGATGYAFANTPIGAGVGAGVGGVSSLVGGIADVGLMVSRHKEQLDYARDKFELNIANIKALPDIITKISALDTNFKLFPFIEEYDCTDAERELFKNKLQYEGYTLGIVDYLTNYIIEDEEHYYKGRLIRTSNDLDNHISEDMNNELSKGVFINGNTR